MQRLGGQPSNENGGSLFREGQKVKRTDAQETAKDLIHESCFFRYWFIMDFRLATGRECD